MTYTHTQTGQQVLPFPCSFAPPARPLCVCAGSGHHADKPSRRCRAPILGVAAARSWPGGEVSPRWLWPQKEDTGDVGIQGMLDQMILVPKREIVGGCNGNHPHLTLLSSTYSSWWPIMRYLQNASGLVHEPCGIRPD